MSSSLKYTDSMDNNRYNSFNLGPAIVLLGGFNGTEQYEYQRDSQTNRTVLSGDTGRKNSLDDNVYHVVSVSDKYVNNAKGAVVIDGFTIVEGNANGENLYGKGGAIAASGVTLDIKQCLIKNNSAVASGGAVYADDFTSLTVKNSLFEHNKGKEGGAVYAKEAVVDIVGTLFRNNEASGKGGALYANETKIELQNSVLQYNSSKKGGGAVLVTNYSPVNIINCTVLKNNSATGGGLLAEKFSIPIIINTIFWQNMAVKGSEVYLTNDVYYSERIFLSKVYPFADGDTKRHPYGPVIGYSDIYGGCEAIVNMNCSVGNINTDPLFEKDGGYGISLSADSPCIDFGYTDVSSYERDVFGNTRVVNGRIDMGAAEFQLN
jgi:predicted outer membrane repeat protein